MKTKAKYLTALVMMFLFLIFIGCSGGGGAPVSSTGTPSTSSLRIVATDAPFSFASVKSATVVIQRIDLHEVTEDAFLTVIEFPEGKELDLVQLRNGVTETLFEGNPPPGSYDAVRIIVHPKEIVIDDEGTERSFVDFKVPSGPQTGIKIFIAPAINVTTTLTTDLVLDFDLSRSFVVQGNPATPAGIKGFIFTPVIRAINNTVAGTLTFLVRSDKGTEDADDDIPLNDAAFTLTNELDEVAASGSSGVNPGDATIEGYVFHPAIPAGDYKLTLTAPGHDPYETQVTINAGNLTDLGAILMARTLGMITGTITTEIAPSIGEPLVFAVPGALVEAGGVSILTDNAGTYQLAGLPTGDYNITISKTGYAAFQGQGTSAPVSDPPVTSDFTIVPLNGNVTGKVTTTSEAEPVPVEGATVRAAMDFGGTPYVIAETTTDAEGVYTLSLPTGSYDLTAVKDDVSSVPVSKDIVGGEDASVVDITM